MNNSTTVDLTKLNYVSAQPEITWIKPADLNDGDQIIGVLQQVKNSDYGLTYILEDNDGKLQGLNGCSSLNKQFESFGLEASIGYSFMITYGGMRDIDSGKQAGKRFHVFDVKRSVTK